MKLDVGLGGGEYGVAFFTQSLVFLKTKMMWRQIEMDGVRRIETVRDSWWKFLTCTISFVQLFSFLFQNPIVLRVYSWEIRPETLSVDYWENEKHLEAVGLV